MRKIKRVENKAEFEIAYKIRLEVFVEEQNVPIEIEADEYDEVATHVLAFENEKPVGCGRIVFFDDYSKIGRVAVLADKRGLGFGKMICQELINIAALEGKTKKVVLNSQCSAAKFYERLGFIAEGEVFDDAGIDHIRMVRML